MKTDEREMKMLWVVTDYGVKELKCYSCKPEHPESWWCPEAGFTGHEGVQIFSTRSAGLTKALVEAAAAVHEAIMKHDKIRMEIASL